MLAFIPSPHTGVVHVGPLTLHMYGLTLLVAILACIWLTGKRWVALGGDWELVTRVAVWGVAFGVVGARLYHDITSWNEVPTPKWQGIVEVWKGGLGVWGGIGLGVIVGCDRRAPVGRERRALHGRRRAGLAARAGHRPDRQLVEPGAVRQADRPAVGAQDRRRAPPAAVLRPRHLPPDLPLRADLGLRRGRCPAVRRAPLPDPAAGALRALRRLVHVRPLLRGAAADRPGPPHRRPAAERLGLDHRLRRLGRLLRLAPVLEGRPAKPQPPEKRPAMAIPKSRVR